MAITKETVVDQITVTDVGNIFYREVTRIMEDGNELTKTYHRTSLYPGQDLTGQPANVASIANMTWTPEIIAQYENSLAAAEAERNKAQQANVQSSDAGQAPA